MLTVRTEAQAEAVALSNHLHRPVYLILNPSFLDGVNTGTPNCPDDISEAVEDKQWPEKVLGLDVVKFLALPSPPLVQLNHTTRQITHLLYHANRPISIVSHSQGCLQVRNAILAAAILGKENEMRDRVAWVATGTPLNDHEIFFAPHKHKYFKNQDDPVPTLIGMHGGAGTGAAARFQKPEHEPIKNYFPKIQPSMLFGGDASLALTKPGGGKGSPAHGERKTINVTFTNRTKTTVHFRLNGGKGLETSLAPNKSSRYRMVVDPGVPPVVTITQPDGKTELVFLVADGSEYEFRVESKSIKNFFVKKP
jgi:hypothetical protein